VAAPKPIVLASFPRGTRAGDFFHELLEHLDFQDDASLEQLVSEKLARFRLAAEHAPTVARAVREVVATRLLAGERGFALRDLPRGKRLNELEFHLPVASAARAGTAAAAAVALTPRALADVLARHASAAVPTSYAARIEHLRFARLEGFLKGFVDVVVEHGGRFYVVDYKTNFLGEELRHYGPEAMARAMDHGHYFLQYHLYCLALHRYLARRLADYDYDQHFGGALYLFVRGMSPATGPELGVFHDKPPLACIQALSDTFDGARKEAAR